MKFVLPVIVLIQWLALPVFAQTPETAQDGGSIWVYLLSSDAVWNVVGSILAILLAILTRSAWVQKVKAKVDEEVWTALEAGVIKTYHDEVKVLKAAAEDRKISREEAENLRSVAISNAKAIATGAGKKALETMARPVLDSMIERLVGKLKKTNSGE